MASRIWILSVGAVLLLTTNAAAATFDGYCTTRFYAESTLHDFEGQVACQPFTLQSERDGFDREMIRQPVVSVLVREMDTDNTARDEKMHDMFECSAFPEIKVKFADMDPEMVLQQLKESNQEAGSLEFELLIRDVARKIKAKTSDVTVTAEQIGFVMEFPLSLASYALEPPSVLGLIKVADQVRVVTRVILKLRTAEQTKLSSTIH